jgi:hypothetical protein
VETDKDFSPQEQEAYEAFDHPKTMLQVSTETSILRANLCRYIARWQKEERVMLDHFGLCPISKHRAGFYQAV